MYKFLNYGRKIIQMKDFQLGIKLWSSNLSSFSKCLELLETKTFDYLELYVVPNIEVHNFIGNFSSYDVILHAPSFNHKFNLIDNNDIYNNGLASVIDLSDVVKSKNVIFHPGIIFEGMEQNFLEKAIQNINDIQELGLFVILENVPSIGIDNKSKLVAPNIVEFEYLVKETNSLICVDVAHTFASANYFKEDQLDFLKSFLKLKPEIIHLCNGDYSAITDKHLALDDGDFPLENIIPLLPNGVKISLETPKNDMINLTDDVRNLNILLELIGS